MTFPSIILASLALALAWGLPASAVRAEEDDTQWLRERHEERLKAAREERNERTKRDPLERLYTPGDGSVRVRPTPQNPLAPIPKGKRPWNIGP